MAKEESITYCFDDPTSIKLGKDVDDGYKNRGLQIKASWCEVEDCPQYHDELVKLGLSVVLFNN